LKIEGPFTVLAPNDDAFAKIPPEDLEGILANIPLLKQILLTHVILGNVMQLSRINLAFYLTIFL